MDTRRIEYAPQIARPAGLDEVEVHSGASDAANQTRRISADYVLFLASGPRWTTLECGRQKEMIPENALVMLEPETVVSISARQPYSYQAIYISPTTFRSLFAAAPGDPAKRVVLTKHCSEHPVMVKTFQAVHEALGGGANAGEAHLAILQLLLGLLGADLMRRLAGNEPHPAVIARAREHIRASYSKGLTLDELSRRVGMCKYALVRAFTREFGISPHAYQTYLRVMKARALIREGRPISDVAFEVGFTDQSHLNRHFKRILGFTPGCYARQMRPRKPN